MVRGEVVPTCGEGGKGLSFVRSLTFLAQVFLAVVFFHSYEINLDRKRQSEYEARKVLT